MKVRDLAEMAKKRVLVYTRGRTPIRQAYEEIAGQSEGLAWHWIQKFMLGYYTNPSQNTLDALLDALDKVESKRAA